MLCPIQKKNKTKLSKSIYLQLKINIMKELILTVCPETSSKNPRFALQLSTNLKNQTCDCSELKVILDNNFNVNINALFTYQNRQRISNSLINEWIIKNKLNDYLPYKPNKIKFLLAIDGNKHTFKFLSF